MPEVTVVIPSVGRPSAERTVASVMESAASEGIDAEIVLVWQAEQAPDGLAGALVLPVHDVNVSHARNRGVDAARAELVAFADDDEVVDRGWLGAALRALADADAAFGPVDPLDENGRPHCYLDHAPPHVFAGYAQPWLVGTGGSMAFRKEALASIGGFNLKLGAGSVGLSGEEPDAIWRLLRAGGRIRWSPEMIAYHPTKDDAGILETRYPYGFGTGRILRRARSPRLVATSAYSILHANSKALASGRATERREAAAFGRGVVAGLTRPTRWLAPELAREAVPAGISEALRGRPADPLPVPMRPPPHYIWACGDAMLHAFIGPDAALLDGPAAREEIGSLPGVGRVPSVLACARSRDALWVLEDRVEGREPDLRNPARWWAAAAAWVTSYARHTGRPYGDSEEWRREREHWLGCAPEGLREQVREVLERVAARPASPSHGGLHSGNLVLTPTGVTATGWSRATTEGIPGADLLLLAATNRGPRADESTVRALVAGRNPPFGDVLGPLRAAGLDGQARTDALLALLLKWAHAERVQHRKLGGEPQAPAFGPMARRLVPLLVSRSRSDVSMPAAVVTDISQVALVVVTRDRAAVFKRFALPSLRGAASEAEILVVDQSAGSDTRELVRELPRARYLRSEPGLSRGRNAAIAATEAEITVFIDDDVEFDADWLHRVAALFDDPEIGVVCGRGIDSSGKPLPGRPAGIYRWPTNPFNVGHGFNMAFRRAALEEAGPFDERLGAGAEVPAAEDTDMFYRVMRNGWTIRCDDGITVRHHDWRTHEEQCAAFEAYGHGFAAQTVKHVGTGDLTAARMAGRHLANHCKWIALFALRRNRRGLAYQSAWARGVVRGLTRRNGSRPAAP